MLLQYYIYDVSPSESLSLIPLLVSNYALLIHISDHTRVLHIHYFIDVNLYRHIYHVLTIKVSVILFQNYSFYMLPLLYPKTQLPRACS